MIFEEELLLNSSSSLLFAMSPLKYQVIELAGRITL